MCFIVLCPSRSSPFVLQCSFDNVLINKVFSHRVNRYAVEIGRLDNGLCDYVVFKRCRYLILDTIYIYNIHRDTPLKSRLYIYCWSIRKTVFGMHLSILYHVCMIRHVCNYILVRLKGITRRLQMYSKYRYRAL